MFQRRRSIRQAGFIRRHQASKLVSMESCSQINDSPAQFSPFKDVSPQPIQAILETYRYQSARLIPSQNHHQTLLKEQKRTKKSSKGTKNQNNKNLKNIDEMTEKQYQKICQKYSKINQNQCKSITDIHSMKAVIITQCNEQIQQITCKPQKICLSLAEAFSLRCHKFKEKLEDERQKFSKSKHKKTSQQRSLSISKIQIEKTSNKTIAYSNKYILQEEKLSQINFVKLKHRKSDGDTSKINGIKQRNQRSQQNKQNCEQNSKINSCRTSRNLKYNNFYIPAPSSKSRQITPRQAYEHSLKKWKQLPQVKAKQKQRQKQAKMKERLIKMKAHSLEVRNKLRR